MTDLQRRLLLLSTGAMALPSMADTAWPNRTIRLLVPFAPGGSSEIVARTVAAELTTSLGQTM